MIRVVERMATMRAAMWWLLLLTGTVAACRFFPQAGYVPVAVPLAGIAAAIAVALVRQPRLRSSTPLAVFHGALALGCVLAGVSALFRFEGRIEIVEGTPFAPEDVEVVRPSLLGMRGPDAGAFVQGTVRARYASGLHRSRTETEIMRPQEREAVTDVRPADVAGYRFSPTANKGYAVALVWTGRDGAETGGWLHLPSYPAFEWRQEHRWRAPDGTPVVVALTVPASPAAGPWVFDASRVPSVIRVTAGETAAAEVAIGQRLALPGGTLRVEAVRLWVGYRITRDPAAPLLFVVAATGLAALALHVLRGGQARRQASTRQGVHRGLVGS